MPSDRKNKPTGLEAKLNRSIVSGAIARNHEGIVMMAVSERRDRAADILAEGLARLLRARTPKQEKVDTPPPSRPHLKLLSPAPSGGPR